MTAHNDTAIAEQPTQSTDLDRVRPGAPGAEAKLPGGSTFDYLTLSLFAERPNSTAQLLRAQHAELLLNFEQIREFMAGGIGESLNLKNAVTKTLANLHLHLQLERGILGKMMSADPRARAMFDQYERELSPLRASISEWSRRFPTPSAIASAHTEFKADTEKMMRAFEERFRHEERDLYLEFDRIVAG